MHAERRLETRPVDLAGEGPAGSETRTTAAGRAGYAEALLDTRRAFDGVASSYARSNAENPLLRAMRDRTRSVVARFVRPGSSILDVGCGPGCDTIFFAAQGYEVTAIDMSASMVAEARRRLEERQLQNRAVVMRIGIDEIDQLDPLAFDAVYSNFGPLNCVADLARAGARIAARLRPGGVLIASVIGRVCPWELALYLARGDARRAMLRYTRGLVRVPLDGRTVWMQYVSPGGFTRAFESAGLTRVDLRSLALFAPPPYLDAFARRHPTLTSALTRLDDTVGRWRLLRGLGDHFLIVMRRD
jgi:SAM-dependent methyltransferase